MIIFFTTFIFTILAFIGYNIYKSAKMIRKYRNTPPVSSNRMREFFGELDPQRPVIEVDFNLKKRIDPATFSVPVKKGIKNNKIQ